IGISREGCPEADDDDTKNKIFVLSLCPKQAEEPYLQFVAHVARILSDEKNIEKIVASKNAAEIHRLFSAKTAK
ncbi:MAG: PTS sugar transporter subunit IIA, partial [Lentisphaerae bacterium]|nr:PTS sugar transporter subunit IIA [Lentisphaerota bacterium]